MMKIKWIIVLGIFVALVFTQQGFAQSGDLELNQIINQAQKKVQEANLLIQRLDEEENTRSLKKSVSADVDSEQQDIDFAVAHWPMCDLSLCDFSVCYFPEENAKSAAEKEKVDKVSRMLNESASRALNNVQRELNTVEQYRATSGGVSRMAAFQMVSEAEVAKAATKTNQAVISVFEFAVQGKADIKTAVCRAKKLLECCSDLGDHRGQVRYLERLVKELDTEGYDENDNPTYGSFETLASEAAAVSWSAYQTSENRTAQARNLSRDTQDISRAVDTTEMHGSVAGMNASVSSMNASRAKVIANITKYIILAIKAREASAPFPDPIGEPGPGSSTSPGSNVPKITAAEKKSPIVVEADANLARAKIFAADPFWNTVANAGQNVKKISELTEGGRSLNDSERSMVSGFNWNGVSLSIQEAVQMLQEIEAKALELQGLSDALLTKVKRQPSPIKPSWPAAAAVAPTTTTTTAPTTTTTTAPTTTTTAAPTTTTTAAPTTTIPPPTTTIPIPTTTIPTTTIPIPTQIPTTTIPPPTTTIPPPTTTIPITTTTTAPTTTTTTATTLPCASPPCP